jgi:hypothetical protein
MKCINCIHRKDDVCLKSGNAIANLTIDEMCEYVCTYDICPCGSNHTKFIEYDGSGRYEYLYFDCKSCGKRYKVVHMNGQMFTDYI